MKLKNLLFVISGPVLGLSTISATVAGVLVSGNKNGMNNDAIIDSFTAVDLQARLFLTNLNQDDIVIYDQNGNNSQSNQISPVSGNLELTNTTQKSNLITRTNKSYQITRHETKEDKLPNEIKKTILDKQDTFSFNVVSNQLGIVDESKIPEGTSLNFLIADHKNNTTDRNRGRITITVEVIETRRNRKLAEKDIDLTGFKTPDPILLGLLNPSQNSFKLDSETLNEGHLTLEQLNAPGTNGQISKINEILQRYISQRVEESSSVVRPNRVNNKSNLTIASDNTYLNNIKRTLHNSTNIFLHEDTIPAIEEVRSPRLIVKKIAKENNDTFFYLGQPNNASFRFNLYKDSKVLSQVLVDNIMIKGLAPSSIRIEPTDSLSDIVNATNQAWLEENKADTTESQKMPYATKSNNFISALKLHSNNFKDKDIYLNSYAINKPDLTQTGTSTSIKVETNLVVSYGGAEHAIRLRTNNKNDIEMLKMAGIELEFLTKAIESTDSITESSSTITLVKLDEEIKKFLDELKPAPVASRSVMGLTIPSDEELKMKKIYKTQIKLDSLKEGNKLVELDIGLTKDSKSFHFLIIPVFKITETDDGEEKTTIGINNQIGVLELVPRDEEIAS